MTCAMLMMKFAFGFIDVYFILLMFAFGFIELGIIITIVIVVSFH